MGRDKTRFRQNGLGEDRTSLSLLTQNETGQSGTRQGYNLHQVAHPPPPKKTRAEARWVTAHGPRGAGRAAEAGFRVLGCSACGPRGARGAQQRPGAPAGSSSRAKSSGWNCSSSAMMRPRLRLGSTSVRMDASVSPSFGIISRSAVARSFGNVLCHK
jgi:hypothetical protein